jgi:hypothetical protein
VADFDIDKAGMEKLERYLQEEFCAGVQIPLDGSESEAIRSVRDQLTTLGVTPNDSEVEKIVRNARNG